MRYLDLLEQIELIEAAKDKYAPMFAFIDQFKPVLDNPSSYINSVKSEIEWATGALRNSDRVIWYLRLVKLNALNSIMEELKFKVHHTDEQKQPDVLVNQSLDEIHLQAFYRWYEQQVQILAQQKGVPPEKLAWENLPFARKRAALISYSKDQGSPIPGSLWAEVDTQPDVAVFQEALKVAMTMYNKEYKKLHRKATVELQAEVDKYKAIAEPLGKKVTAIKDVCATNPNHEDCGNTLEELESRFELYNKLWSIAVSSVDLLDSRPGTEFPLQPRVIRGDLQHFESINYEPMHDYQFGWKSFTIIKGSLKAFEEHWASRAKRILSHDDDDYKDIEKVLEFDNGWAWWNLRRPHCEREGEAMGHCGNDYDNMREEDEVLSLREPMGTKDEAGFEEWKPHLTFIFDTKKGTLSEMKGFKNNKPEPKYHRFIVPLLQQDWVQGIALRAHQHEKENNFFVSDLDKEIASNLIQEKPGLLTKVDRDKLGVDMELPDFGEGPVTVDDINEMLDEWSIENIEADDDYDDTVYVLHIWDDEEDAYNDMSGESWPDESDVDYPEAETRDEIYGYLSNYVKDKFIRYVAIDYPEASLDAAGLDLEDEGAVTLDDVAADLDFSEALSILQDDYGTNPMEDEVDLAWRRILAKDMQFHASQSVNEMENNSSGMSNMPDGREYGSIVWNDERIFLEIDREEFMQDVYPQLEEFNRQRSRYNTGTAYWAYILGFTVYGIGDYFAEIERENLGNYERSAAEEAESAIDKELTNYIRAHAGQFDDWVADRVEELKDEEEAEGEIRAMHRTGDEE